MRISYYLLVNILLLSQMAIAQKKTVTGMVSDQEGQPLPGVNVIVRGSTKGAQTDFDGNYSIDVNSGAVLVFSYIGMTSVEVEVKAALNINVELKENAQELEEVVVTFKEPLVEADKGKVTFNVASSATSSGVSSFDLLKKIPGVSIGQNEEIVLRGTTGVNVMIDGKMSYLSGNQLGIFLKGLSVEDIAKVELITNPSAAYDAAGNSGIINIVTKKNRARGYALSLKSSVSKGRSWMNNQNISGSIHEDKWSAYASFDYNTPHRFRRGESGNTIVEEGEQMELSRENQNPFDIYFYTWKAGGDWQFTPKHRIGAHYHGYLDDFSSTKTSTIRKHREDGSLFSNIHSTYDLEEPYHYDAINIDYQFDIDTTGKKITADARYISYRNFSDGLMEGKHYNAEGQLRHTNTMHIHQPGFIKIKSIQADADLPFPEVGFKAGLKFAEAGNDNNFRSEEKTADGFVEIPELTNHFKYKEQISAAYVSASKTFGNVEVEAGLRLEHTRAKALLLDGSFANNWKYTRLFPNLSVGYFPDDDHKIDLAVSRRINRPSYSSLNPVRWYNDEYFYFSGNPELVPEMAWQFSASYTFRKKYILTTGYSKRSDYISRHLSFDDNGVTVKSQSANFTHFDRVDIDIMAPLQLAPYWDVQFFGGLNHTSYPISQRDTERTFSRWASTFSVQQQIRIFKHYTLDVSLKYTSAELRGVYLAKEVFFADLGIKRSFLDGKLDAVFTLSDIFDSYREKGVSKSNIINYSYNDKPDSRRVGLTFRYHFGGNLVKEKTTKTDEQKRL
ncbi:TonB-dependent receptor domain-containing protein [Sinomicrobium sp. M5D2P9]